MDGQYFNLQCESVEFYGVSVELFLVPLPLDCTVLSSSSSLSIVLPSCNGFPVLRSIGIVMMIKGGFQRSVDAGYGNST
jgi:hypothetical protein